MRRSRSSAGTGIGGLAPQFAFSCGELRSPPLYRAGVGSTRTYPSTPAYSFASLSPNADPKSRRGYNAGTAGLAGFVAARNRFMFVVGDHTAPVYSLAFSPSGLGLASAMPPKR